jgi:2-dehydropantoate 2-reductase
MRFVVYGAGAIGGVLGARLSSSGHDVTLVARGAHYEAIRDGGLTVRTPEGTEVARIAVVDDPQRLELRSDDVVLVSVKGQDTPAVLRALAAHAPPSVAVACVQNGVENERAALRLFENVYGVCVMSPCVHLEPGVVEVYSSPLAGILDVGRYPAGSDSVADAIAEAFRASTYASESRGDIMRWKYRKLLHNLGNAVEAICGPQARAGRISDLAEEEGEACLRAAGVDFASAEEDEVRRGDLVTRRPVGDRARPGGSSWQSLSRSTGTIETDYLSGEIVMLGRLHGVPTPVNSVLQLLATRIAAERRPPGSVPAEEALRLAGVSGPSGASGVQASSA